MVSQGRPISARATAYEIADDGVDELGPWLKGRPWAMPFLSNVADATLAASFSPRYLWGIDQEFVGAPAILLDLLAKWKAIDKAALDAGQFDKIMLQTARPAYFADLRTRFKDSVALTAIGEAMRDLPVYARFTLLGFDYLVTTRDAKPATHFEAR